MSVDTQIDALPLSFAQERLWFLDQLQPGSPAYVVFDAVRISGDLDVDMLRAALDALVERHEVLRSTFPSIAGRPVQVVQPAVPLELPVTDLRLVAAAEREAGLARMLQEEAARPLPLEVAPLLRARLFRLSATDHVLTIAVHHIAYDAWSDQVLWTELGHLYGAARNGSGATLPELELQYADYAVWQRDWLSGATLRRELDHWRQELDGAPQLLSLPLDRPRPRIQHFAGRDLPFTLSVELQDAVRELARSEGTTVFVVLLAAFQAALHRYSDEASVLVGTPVINRGRVELEPLIGLFANTLVMRADFTDETTGTALIQQIRTRSLTALAHQDLPFEALVEDLAPARETSHQPVFQVMFALHNAAGGGLQLEGLDVSPVRVQRDTAMFDLLLYVDERQGGLFPLLQYNSDLFDERTVARLAGHLQTLLAALTADPRRRIDALPLLTRAELDELERWNRTGHDFGPQASRPAPLLIHEQATASPDLIAVRQAGQQLTYRELDLRCDRLAHRLQRLGVRPGTRVAICLDRSIELVVALLAVLRAGGAYVPLDPEHPAQRLAQVIDDAAPEVLVGSRSTLERCRTDGLAVVSVDDPESGADVPDDVVEASLQPADLAYVIYTSGSTGRPKGVMVDHAGLTNRLLWMQREYGLTPEDRLLQKTPYGFDVSVWEFLWPLMVGATLVVAEPGGHTDPAYLADVIEREAITTIHFVPSMLEVFLDEPDLERRCASLRRVYCSGEALSPALRDRFLARLSAELHNEYGPTETGEVTATPCNEVGGPLGIGRPIANTTAHVVDRLLQPVPVGIPGELLIGGAALARGYHAQPGMTADRYLPDPFDRSGGGRLYRTGDVCRRLPDGSLDYLGRNDHQLKIRGFRIEPAEIEAALLLDPVVRQAAVVARQDRPGDPRLVAYLVTDEPRPTAREIRVRLATLLPRHLVPAEVVLLETLPVTSNGKLDRRALPAPEPTADDDAAGDPPRTAEEAVLADIWADVLGLEQVGIHDNFFELGGHSLLATRVVARARTAFDADLSLRSVFEHPTVAGLVTRLEPHQDQVPIPVLRDRAEPRLLSSAQQQVWFLDRLVPGSAAYNIVDARLLTGTLDVRALGRALSEIVRRHEALRSRTVTVAGAPLVQVDEPYAVELSPTPLDRDGLAGAVGAEAAEPVLVGSGRLLRARLWRLAVDEHVLCLTVHHSAFDEWSLDVLHTELSVLYAAYVHGAGSPLPELVVQHADVAAWQRQQLESGALAPQLEHWLRELEDAPELLDLPTDRPRPATQSYAGGRVRVDLPPDLVAAVRQLARREDATLFMTYLAAFETLLHRLTGQRSVVVGTPFANRSRPEVQPLVGLLVNTLVMRADFDDDPGFGDLLRQVKRRALGAYSHAELPYERLVEVLAPTREVSHNPVFQVMFACTDAGADPLRLEGLRQVGVPVENGTSKFDLTLDVFDLGDDRVELELEYSSDLFDATSVVRLAEQLQRLLRAAASAPTTPVSRLPLLSPEEAEAERAWSTGDEAPAYERPVHEAVADWARRTPDAPAVRWDSGVLTYAELSARADRAAAELQRRGAGPESVVATCLPRGPELVTAELAILRAGAAYLPLDPENPPNRLSQVCADAGARLVVSTARLADRVGPGVGLVDLDALGDAPGAPVPVPLHPRNLAYVIYTSGSTGRPKGVMIEHASLANVVGWRQRRAGLGPSDRSAMIASPGFDASVTDIWTPLCAGACICVPDQETRLVPARLQQWLLDLGVTVTEVATPLAELLLDLPWRSPCPLRLLIAGGDRLHTRPAGDVPFAVLNEYGPTENTATSTAGLVATVEVADGLPSIGTPIDQTTASVVDEAYQRRPLGAVGELLLGGAGVARGYLGRPDLTAERFLPDPYATRPGARAYASSDRVRRRTDGALEFLGRSDGQVKIRGFRIELGEVTAALRAHADVADAYVAVRGDSADTNRALVAWVVPADPLRGVGSDELRTHLLAELPAYMAPSAYVVLPALPLNRSGKVDAHALPEPQRGPAVDRLVSPSNALEARLVALWAEVLQLDQIGVEDSFFELGGHSLLLAQVHGRLLTAVGRAVPLVALFEHPTIRSLARHLTAGLPEPRPTERRAEVRSGRARLNRRNRLSVPTHEGTSDVH